MRLLARVLIVIVETAGIFAASKGLAYTIASIALVLRGGFDELVNQHQHGLRYFYVSFYVMATICIVCYLLLLFFCTAILLFRLRWARLLIFVFLFELVYFVAIIIGCQFQAFAFSIAGALGVANGGMTYQMRTLLPLWAPFALWWAKHEMYKDREVIPLAI